MLGLGLSIPEVAIRRRGTWSPASIFASGEAGAWYDPSDLNTLWQDSAGTTPVTAVEQPVGLMLDKSRGLVLGSELVTNGGFVNGLTNWTASGGDGASVVSERLRVSLTAGAGAFSGGRYQDVSVVAGRFQRVSVSIETTATSANSRIGVVVYDGAGFSTVLADLPNDSAGSKTVTLYVRPTGVIIRVYARVVADATTTATGFFDNISVRELAGNHAFNTNATTVRPVLSARYNLLTRTEEFENAAWSKQSVDIISNAVAAPIGGSLTADLMYPTSSGLARSVYQTINNGNRVSVYAKAAGFSHLWFINAGGGATAAWFNLSTGQKGTVAAGYTTTIEPIGSDGWYRCTVQATSGVFIYAQIGVSDADNTSSATPSGTNGVYLWGADLRVANESATIPYQRVVTSTDYDADPTKFPYYLRFDGSDDWLQTASIDFSTVTSDGQPRRNLLSFPTAFDESVWAKNNAGVTSNVTAAPDGLLTADGFQDNDGSSPGASQPHTITQLTVAITSGAQYVFSIYAKKNTYSILGLGGAASVFGLDNYANFNLNTGAIAEVGSATVATISPVGTDGWFRCSIAITATSTATSGLFLYLTNDSTGRAPSYAATGKNLFVWGAQLETGSTATAFQNIGTDKMSVFAGVRRQGVKDGSATFRIVELSTSSANNGIFTMAGPDGASDIVLGSRGTGIVVSNVTSGYGSPSTEVLTGLADISADVASLRHNGAQIATSAADQGTGNYGNYPLYIGRRGGTSQPFNGRIYSLLVLGRTATADEIASAETWVNGKTGAY